MTLILSVLAETPMHGYELLKTIRSRGEGNFDLSDGTVYSLLYNLRDNGSVRSEIETSTGGATARSTTCTRCVSS